MPRIPAYVFAKNRYGSEKPIWCMCAYHAFRARNRYENMKTEMASACPRFAIAIIALSSSAIERKLQAKTMCLALLMLLLSQLDTSY